MGNLTCLGTVLMKLPVLVGVRRKVENAKRIIDKWTQINDYCDRVLIISGIGIMKNITTPIIRVKTVLLKNPLFYVMIVVSLTSQ